MNNQPTSTVTYYNQVSPIGKPILDLLGIEYKQSCIATLNHLEYFNDWNFNCLTGIKYLWRLGQKTEDYSSDMAKAIDYFTWAVENRVNEMYPSRVAKVEQAIAALKELINDTI